MMTLLPDCVLCQKKLIQGIIANISLSAQKLTPEHNVEVNELRTTSKGSPGCLSNFSFDFQSQLTRWATKFYFKSDSLCNNMHYTFAIVSSKGYLNNKMSAVNVEVWAVLATHALGHHLHLFAGLCTPQTIQCALSECITRGYINVSLLPLVF